MSKKKLEIQKDEEAEQEEVKLDDTKEKKLKLEMKKTNHPSKEENLYMKASMKNKIYSGLNTDSTLMTKSK